MSDNPKATKDWPTAYHCSRCGKLVPQEMGCPCQKEFNESLLKWLEEINVHPI